VTPPVAIRGRRWFYLLRSLSLFATESGSVLTIEYIDQESKDRHLACYKRSSLNCIHRVVNGDTLDGNAQRIKLYGVDAPELPQSCKDKNKNTYPCGLKAAAALAEEIGDKIVNCTEKDKDRYGRSIAICYSGGTELNKWMVENGWAVAYRIYSRDYVKSESIARRKRLNIWQGNFIFPSVWREETEERENWEWQGDLVFPWLKAEEGKYWAWQEEGQHPLLTYF